MNDIKKALRTIDLKPNHGEMIKASEAIDIVGVDKLTLQDQRIWNFLLENAHPCCTIISRTSVASKAAHFCISTLTTY